MSRVEESTEAKLYEIADIIQSGQTELTGRAKRDPYTEKIVGRFGGGIKIMYPELAYFRESPSTIAKAIRRGKGKLYERTRSAVKESVEYELPEAYLETGLPKRKRAPERPTIAPHEAITKRCKVCGAYHGKGAHRFHGEGSFHKTHLFSFGANPMMTEAQAKREFAELMAEARKRQLTLKEKQRLTLARQALRRHKRPASNKLSVTKARKMLHEGQAGGYPLTSKQWRMLGARASGYPVRPAKNPHGEVIGKVVEIRYRRTAGQHRGYFKHTFRKQPTLYTLPDGSVRIK